MAGGKPADILIEYDPVCIVGRIIRQPDQAESLWTRLISRSVDEPDSRQLGANELEFPWPAVLSILRDFGTRTQQQHLGFRFRFLGEAEELARKFAEEVRAAKATRSELTITLSVDDARAALVRAGYTRRVLREFQERDLLRLITMRHGANFSVPGAGKTSVTLALHMLVRSEGHHLMVFGPKASFPAWQSVVEECVDPQGNPESAEPFTLLSGGADENEQLLRSGATRFLMSYDLMIRQQDVLSAYFARQPVHVVLDEAHRMKAGFDSQRGAFLLNVAPLAARRDILTGTPMPQGPQDLASQLGFLWPGHGLDLQIQRGMLPRDVLGQLYVRTTKHELKLPAVTRHFLDVEMSPGQMALYGLVRNETLRSLSSVVSRQQGNVDFLGAKRSVLRLLQLSANPLLALRGIVDDIAGVNSGVIDAVIEEGVSAKIRAVVSHAREIAASGNKVVIWTIFTDNILELERLLADLNPVSLYGAIPSGAADDLATREGRLRRFHKDDACSVLIGNPAAAGEGISLHTACHNAIYLDRSYVSTHYLQSIDRIHRLGLDEGVETNIYIYRTKAPAELGSIDYSVSRRLLNKIRGLQELLDDPDLKQIALDEENADDPVDYSVDLQDLVDLVEELEGRRPAPSEEEAD